MSPTAVRIWATRTGYSGEATRMGSGDMRLWQIDGGAREEASGTGRSRQGRNQPARWVKQGMTQGGARVRCGRSRGGRSQARLVVAHWWPGPGGNAMGAARSSRSSRREKAHEARLLDGAGAAKRSRASALVLSSGAATSRRRWKQRATRGRGHRIWPPVTAQEPGAASWRGNGAEEG